MPSLRQILRAKRRALTERQQLFAAHHLAKRLACDLTFLRAKRVAFYLPNDGEIDPSSLIEWCHQMRKKVYLPVMPEGLVSNQQRLLFQSFIPGTTPLVSSKFGILEPPFLMKNCIKPSMLNLVFLPLVGFDRKGNRLGMGGGYYDKTFIRRDSDFHRPRLIGLAHSIQETEDIVRNPWDIPLDAVFTELETISFCGTARTISPVISPVI
jgi:5-formyltetrahydrofolate cyclo-ligase